MAAGAKGSMTKTELVESLTHKHQVNRSEAEGIIDTVVDEIVSALKQGERVNISGFGSFAVSTRRARTGRNPRTGVSIEISASRSARFRPGKQLRDALNQGPRGAAEPKPPG